MARDLKEEFFHLDGAWASFEIMSIRKREDYLKPFRVLCCKIDDQVDFQASEMLRSVTEATVLIEIFGEEELVAANGRGPVHAVDNAMRKIYAPPKKADSLLANAKGKVFVNCATISPKVHVEVEKLARKAGAGSLEACMASSITQAREGTLYLMCGGDQPTFERVKPVLERLSASMRYIGKAGQAAVVKALVNMVMNINTAALAEGLGLGQAFKLDLGMLREVFSQTGANSRVLQTDGEDMQNREHSCFFSSAHAAKDSGIALSLAKEKGLNLPLAAATKKQYDRMVKEGLGELDKSGIAELTFKGRGR